MGCRCNTITPPLDLKAFHPLIREISGKTPYGTRTTNYADSSRIEQT